MTFNEILKSDKEFLIPTDIAPVLRCKPYSINIQAHEDPGKLGFPVCLMGRDVRIPRRAFVKWMEQGGCAE